MGFFIVHLFGGLPYLHAPIRNLVDLTFYLHWSTLSHLTLVLKEQYFCSIESILHTWSSLFWSSGSNIQIHSFAWLHRAAYPTLLSP